MRSATSPGRRSPPRPSSCSSPARRSRCNSARNGAHRASSPRHRRPSRPPREARPSPTACDARLHAIALRDHPWTSQATGSRLLLGALLVGGVLGWPTTACSGGTSSPRAAAGAVLRGHRHHRPAASGPGLVARRPELPDGQRREDLPAEARLHRLPPARRWAACSLPISTLASRLAGRTMPPEHAAERKRQKPPRRSRE